MSSISLAVYFISIKNFRQWKICSANKIFLPGKCLITFHWWDYEYKNFDILAYEKISADKTVSQKLNFFFKTTTCVYWCEKISLAFLKMIFINLVPRP